jgi:SpoVK/Ycf46/Vps4 family AAA+-type ATPase
VVSASGNDENAEVCEVKESLRALSLASPSASTAAPVYAEDDVASVERALTSCSLRLFEVVHSTCIELVTNTPEALLSPRDRPRKELVVGLDAILDQLRSFLMTHLSRAELFRNRNLKPPRGVLLFGAPGVGKSSLAKQLASELEAEGTFDVEFVNCVSLQSQTAIVGQAERTLSRFFRLPPPIETKKSTRAKLLVLDDIHLICPKRGGYNSGTDRLTATLLSLMDGLDSSDQIYTLAVTGQPSVLDPALRRPGRLDAEIEVPIPDDAPTRAEILKFHVTNFSSALDGADEDQWLDLAKLAKGFNGADCMLAVKEALRHSILARSCDSPLVPPDATGDTMTGRPLSLTVEDLKAGIRSTKPSAIKSITVEIPQVQWSSIGGMESVKNELFEALELPLTHGSLLQRLRVPPPRGILFYGPPGCAKTLMARALATQGHMNFLAVKGPELLSKWLGESERALASLFRRARMASPSIIFFDEIDAIACRRGGSGENASNRLLSQLLTELDGVNSTGSVANAASSCSSSSIAASGASSKPKQQRVVVIGATNRPDLLDPALTRPGRIDRLIYVGVPDERGRAQIFRIGLRGRACDDDVNVEELAQERVSGGYSGAEIAAICRDAALLALEEASNENTSNVLAGGGSPIHIGQRHLLQAVSGMKRQITPEMTAFYDSYRDGSGSSKKNQKRL